jgi:hypothetical protein
MNVHFNSIIYNWIVAVLGDISPNHLIQILETIDSGTRSLLVNVQMVI